MVATQTKGRRTHLYDVIQVSIFLFFFQIQHGINTNKRKKDTFVCTKFCVLKRSKKLVVCKQKEVGHKISKLKKVKTCVQKSESEICLEQFNFHSTLLGG